MLHVLTPSFPPRRSSCLELAEAPVGDVADILLDLLGRHAGDGALLEREIDEGVLEADRLLADVHDVLAHRLGHAVTLLDEGVEQLGDALAMEALVAHRPAADLAHSLHLVEAREVHQHREDGEALKALGSGTIGRTGGRERRYQYW